MMLFIPAITAFSQTNPITSHYSINSFLVNPALSGVHGGIGFLAGYRSQWTSVPGAPQTVYFAADMALPQARSGAGMHISFDKLGAYSFTGINLAYAYRQPVGKWILSPGINAGITLQQLDGSKLVTPGGDYTGGDPDHQDDILPTDKFKSIRPELGVGIAATLPENVEIGISVQNLINAATKIEGTANSAELTWGRTFHLHAKGGIKTGEHFSLHPALSLRTDFNNFQLDLSASVSFKQFIFAGLGFRGYNKNAMGALIPMLGCKPVRNMNIMYSYDADVGTIKKYSNGSHELSIQYIMPIKNTAKRPKVIYNPRFL